MQSHSWHSQCPGGGKEAPSPRSLPTAEQLSSTDRAGQGEPVMRTWGMLPQDGVEGLSGLLKWEFQGRGLEKDREGWG